MNIRRLLGAYAIGVGLAIFGLWVALLGTGQVPELRTAPIEIGYHLVAEGLTAVLLLVAGIAVLRGSSLADRLLAFSLGMLLYTVVNSAGYYGQLGEWAMVGMFAALTLLTALFGWVTVRGTGFDADAPPIEGTAELPDPR